MHHPDARLVSCLVVLALLLASGGASAQADGRARRAAATPASAADEEARARFESGRLAFAAGRYADALSDFRRAYELSQRPVLLYNIGVAADRLRRDQEALEAFERYLREVEAPDNRAEVEARVVVLREQLAARATPAPTEPSARVGVAADPVAPVPASESNSSPMGEPSAGEGGRLWTWVALGAAGASAATAIYFWVDANAAHDDLEASCGNVGCTQAQIDDSGGPTSVTLTNVFLATAGVGLAAAVTLYFVEGDEDDEPEGSAALGVGPGFVTFSGRF